MNPGLMPTEIYVGAPRGRLSLIQMKQGQGEEMKSPFRSARNMTCRGCGRGIAPRKAENIWK